MDGADLGELRAVRAVLALPEEPALVRTWTWREVQEGAVPGWLFERPPAWMREAEIVWRDPRFPVEFRGLVLPGQEDTARDWLWPER